jgi:hypothetical protein
MRIILNNGESMMSSLVFNTTLAGLLLWLMVAGLAT